MVCFVLFVFLQHEAAGAAARSLNSSRGKRICFEGMVRSLSVCCCGVLVWYGFGDWLQLETYVRTHRHLRRRLAVQALPQVRGHCADIPFRHQNCGQTSQFHLHYGTYSGKSVIVYFFNLIFSFLFVSKPSAEFRLSDSISNYFTVFMCSIIVFG